MAKAEDSSPAAAGMWRHMELAWRRAGMVGGEIMISDITHQRLAECGDRAWNCCLAVAGARYFTSSSGGQA